MKLSARVDSKAFSLLRKFNCDFRRRHVELCKKVCKHRNQKTLQFKLFCKTKKINSEAAAASPRTRLRNGKTSTERATLVALMAPCDPLPKLLFVWMFYGYELKNLKRSALASAESDERFTQELCKYSDV